VLVFNLHVGQQHQAGAHLCSIAVQVG
jgi:hypothetical protein